MRYLTADLLFTGTSAPLGNAVLALEDDGTIAGISESAPDNGEVIRYPGALCPGFVNMHGHLELAGMKRRIPEGTGLTAFLREVVRTRGQDGPGRTAMEAAEKEMIREGIVAAADISNTEDSFDIKRQENLYYHTFIEVFGLDPLRAKEAIDGGVALAGLLPEGQSSVTPHAPYSVSKKLFDLVSAHAARSGGLLSIHNQECEAENEWFEHGTGPFVDFFRSMHLDPDPAVPRGMRPLASYLPLLPGNNKLLLVHNTFCNVDDVQFASTHSKNIYWCFCPRANLFIEKKLPDFRLFDGQHGRCCVGTDSYASNGSLSILEELKVIGTAAPYLPLETLVRWATMNGAEFLGIGNRYGSIAPGKKPGVNLIRNLDLKQTRLTPDSEVEKLA